jgi:hypothetical protein
MRKGRFVSILLPLVAFAAASLFGSGPLGSDAEASRAELASSQAKKSLEKRARFAGVLDSRPGDYVSPGQDHKLIIDASNQRAIDEARDAGAYELGDYGSFKLMAVDEHALKIAADLRGSGDPLDPVREWMRDDLNVLMLRSGAIDTTAEDAPGRLLKSPAATGGSQVRESPSRFRLIQFAGPVKGQWLEALRSAGLEPIAYVPNNGYLVRAESDAAAAVVKLSSAAGSRGENFVQWEAPFIDEYKIHPQLVEAMNSTPEQEVSIAVQIVPPGTAASQNRARRGTEGTRRKQEDADVRTARQLAITTITGPYEVGVYTNLKLKVLAANVGRLAALSGVVNIEPWSPPQLFDERSAQVLVRNLTADGRTASGPGYLNWLASRGFTSRFSFGIDVTDTGVDRGFTDPANLHADLLDESGQSRLIYARDFTADGDAGDIPGHGTINLSIAGGANRSASAAVKDKDGFAFGIGIAPFALLGSSKIFEASGRFGLSEPYTNLISQAYLDGARISSNSWGDTSNQYTLDSQEYDSRVRDAVPSQAGNQELLICFAVGNTGTNGFVSSLASAKNVLAVGASESSRGDGEDGCGVENADSDNIMDIAFFSSAGPLDDRRSKPDLVAGGSHIMGAATQHPDFDGTGVCGEDFDKPFFPPGQTLYTWSSGTSHSTPQVAGGAALLRQFFLNRGEQPSAALLRALLVNTTTYMTGERAGGNLPQDFQGWGLMDLNRAMDGVPKIFIDQTQTLGDSGQEFVFTGEVKDSGQPFRVTLTWTDAPGFSAFAPWTNNLDLEVVANGQVYRGNNLKGQESVPGGVADSRNNIEAVWLPAGTTGSFLVRVRASNIAGDGLPGNLDQSDQDFALVVYNGERKDVPVAGLSSVAVNGGSDSFADPGEAVTMTITLTDLSPIALNGARGTLSSPTAGVSITGASSDFPNIAPGQTGQNVAPLTFSVAGSVACGSEIQFALDVVSATSQSRIPFKVAVGRLLPVEVFADNAEAGESQWTHGSLMKKKKKKTPIDTWSIATKRFRSPGHAWFSADPPQTADTFLASVPIQIPADIRNIQLVFFHTFQFEFGFDGGVLEISTGGGFEDLGPKIVSGGYNGSIFAGTDNPLAGRPGWVFGRLGALQPVVVDLSSFAGRTVTIRFRFGSDSSGKAQGWYIDDIGLRAERVLCTPAAQ